MAEVGAAFVSIVPSARGFRVEAQQHQSARRLRRPAPRAASSTAAGSSRQSGRRSRVSARIFAVGAVVKGIQSVVAEAREAEKVTAITANRIKTMGNAANISAAQIGKLANSIARKTGVDDEAIQSGANLLLTFKNVREEVGKGNDIFTRATQIVTDMSREKGMGGLEASSIRLGKALNDPVKGISALSRVGVQFSAEQKKMIKDMVKQGDILGAQKIILKELEDTVRWHRGGVGNSWREGQRSRGARSRRQFGTALLPLLGPLADPSDRARHPGVCRSSPTGRSRTPALQGHRHAIGLIALALPSLHLCWLVSRFSSDLLSSHWSRCSRTCGPRPTSCARS